MRLSIGHLYPLQMNIYGDRGNILTLVQRARWRGIEVEVESIDVGQRVDFRAYDLVFFGGGQDSNQALIAEDFLHLKGPALREAVEDGLVVLAICGGYQLMGRSFRTHTGTELPGVGIFDAWTVGGRKRLIGNIVVEWDGAPGDAPHRTIVGFENHSGRTFLGPGCRPLGRVRTGYGNNARDRTEGAVYRNAIGCYLHGSLLPKNPHLADHLLLTALRRRYGPEIALASLDDRLEWQAHRAMLRRLGIPEG
ncbi:MAG: type 1 glutamine amidotransferase [Chloroflexia bacterium]